MKYPGSKWGSADWIISHFPEHHSYLEPFFGSGGVFFNKPRSDIETINDLDGEVVNLFQQIRNDPERLAREIYFTPYSREVYEMAYQKEPENDLEKAVLFYTRLNRHGPPPPLRGLSPIITGFPGWNNRKERKRP